MGLSNRKYALFEMGQRGGMDGVKHAAEALEGATDARLHLAMLRTPSTIETVDDAFQGVLPE